MITSIPENYLSGKYNISSKLHLTTTENGQSQSVSMYGGHPLHFSYREVKGASLAQAVAMIEKWVLTLVPYDLKHMAPEKWQVSEDQAANKEVVASGSLTIRFSIADFGFGEIYMYQDKEGRWIVSNECMSLDVVLNIIVSAFLSALDATRTYEKVSEHIIHIPDVMNLYQKNRFTDMLYLDFEGKEVTIQLPTVRREGKETTVYLKGAKSSVKRFLKLIDEDIHEEFCAFQEDDQPMYYGVLEAIHCSAGVFANKLNAHAFQAEMTFKVYKQEVSTITLPEYRK